MKAFRVSSKPSEHTWVVQSILYLVRYASAGGIHPYGTICACFSCFYWYLKCFPSPERISILIQEEVTRQVWGPELNKGQTLGFQLEQPLLNEDT